MASVGETIHAALLTALHEHPEPAVTATEPEPPAAGEARLAGEIVGVQPVVVWNVN